ncbi:MAG: Molybdopterin-guanine dinucleotide biosynthesis adapter protein [Alphaproteobacteria bacterium MarineAlpha5_Bin9]|nr:MAG: Molybdopterin-guanine dinucleotide biosynthesis adapter protein [Alphaproteobacteria bacterium MarineAlpha5_Bin9]|tara:strand:+ start:1632 stop:2120 length:489 start_codon:yes stop_codon:yes gene_type:complete
MIICGIVGLKNSGKTFLSQELIKHFSSLSYKVASIKHAHHNFEIDTPNTDSFLHRQAGSSQVIISSSKRWAKISEIKDDQEKKLEDLIDAFDSPDIVFFEGYKNSFYPKIEVISNPKKFLFPNLKNVIGIVSEFDLKVNLPVYKFSNLENISKLIIGINSNE